MTEQGFDDDVPDDGPFTEPRPYTTRRPEGDQRPYTTRPYTTRPYTTRPYTTRPYTTRPYTTRPYPTRPYTTRTSPPGDAADGDTGEWAADLSDLFGERSAVLRLGARTIRADRRLTLTQAKRPEEAARSARDGQDQLRYSIPASAADRYGAAALECREAVDLVPEARFLDPGRHTLAVSVDLPMAPFADLRDHALLGWALKNDLAGRLGDAADAVFLTGDGRSAPLGVVGYANPDGGLALEALWDLVVALQAEHASSFLSAGWILHPEILGELGRRPRAPFERAIVPGGADAGELLGLPYIVSTAARIDGNQAVFLSADWGEAWLGIQGGLAEVEIVPVPAPLTGGVQIRVVIGYDFALRRPELFRSSRMP